MSLNQPVGAGAAYEKGAEQHPEGTRARGVAQAEQCRDGNGRAGRIGGGSRSAGLGCRSSGLRGGIHGSEWPQAEIGRPVAHEQPNQQRRSGEQRTHQTQGRAPARAGGDRGQQRQEYQLTRRRTRRQQSHDQTAARIEPAGRYGGGQHQGRQTRAKAHHHPPEQNELPDLGHAERQGQAQSDQKQCTESDFANAVAVDEGGRERPHEPEQQQAQRQARGNGGRGPAEFALQGQQQHAGAPTAPAVTSMVRKVVPTTTQP